MFLRCWWRGTAEESKRSEFFVAVAASLHVEALGCCQEVCVPFEVAANVGAVDVDDLHGSCKGEQGKRSPATHLEKDVMTADASLVAPSPLLLTGGLLVAWAQKRNEHT